MLLSRLNCRKFHQFPINKLLLAFLVVAVHKLTRFLSTIFIATITIISELTVVIFYFQRKYKPVVIYYWLSLPVPIIGLIAPMIEPLRLFGLLTTTPFPRASPELVALLLSNATVLSPSTLTDALLLRSEISSLKQLP